MIAELKSICQTMDRWDHQLLTFAMLVSFGIALKVMLWVCDSVSQIRHAGILESIRKYSSQPRQDDLPRHNATAVIVILILTLVIAVVVACVGAAHATAVLLCKFDRTIVLPGGAIADGIISAFFGASCLFVVAYMGLPSVWRFRDR